MGSIFSKDERVNIFSRMSKDVTMNIFSRLPAKSVGKSMCVCKEWRSIISDPLFKSLHKERSSRKPNVLFLQTVEKHDLRDLSDTVMSLDDLFDFSGTGPTEIHMSSVDFDGNLYFDCKLTVDALVLDFLPSKWELICIVSNTGFHVCNPSTQELVNLATSDFSHDQIIGIGFGYTKERNEYVLVSAYFSNQRSRCEVMRWTDGCCLKDCSWKDVDIKCPYSLFFDGVFVESCFYWIGYVPGKYDELLIVSFDPLKEEFGTMVPLGGVSLEPMKFHILVELKGILCLADSPEDKSTMNIWVLKDSKNHMWVKEYTIDLSAFNHGVELIIPLGYREGKILMNVKSKSLEWYDVQNKCFKRIYSQISGRWRWCGLYTDGLFSLESLSAT